MTYEPSKLGKTDLIRVHR